jgi:hypothetical protein
MRFSIRDVLFATTIVALALGWWLDHALLKQREAATAERYLEDVRSYQQSNADIRVRLQQAEREALWPVSKN